MSGPLPAHRTPSRPLLGDSGESVYKVPSGPFDGAMDWHAIKRTLKPNGVYENGRCVEFTVLLELRERHVLDYRPEPHFPSKHARGRMRPRTPAEQGRIERLQRRAAQIGRSTTVALNRLAEPQAA